MTWTLLSVRCDSSRRPSGTARTRGAGTQLRIEVPAHEATIEMVRQRFRLRRRELALVGDRKELRGLAAIDRVGAGLLICQTSSPRGRSAAAAVHDGG